MEELLDVLDEHGRPTGEALPYDEVHERGLWHAVALVWIVNHENDFLVQRRSPQVRFDPNKWDCRFGGHMSAGTTGLEGAIRELQEEIGITTEPSQLEFLFRGQYEDTRGHATQVKRHVTENYLYRWPKQPPMLTLDPAEVSETRWVPLDELKTWIARSPDEFVLHADDESRVFSLLRERIEAN